MASRLSPTRLLGVPHSAAARTAVALGLVAVVLAVFVVVVRLVVSGSGDGAVPAGQSAPAGLSVDGQAAVDAARQEALNLISYSQANFDKDYARSLAGTTGDLQTQLKSSEATTKSALTKGKFDLTGQITAAGLVSVQGPTAVVLVSSNGYQKVGSKSTLVANNRLQLTMTKVGGTWLISGLESVGLV